MSENTAKRAQELKQRLDALERALATSERQLALERLKLEQTEAALGQMAGVVGNAPVAVLLADPDGVVTDLNVEAERRIGRRRQDVLGEHLAELVPEARRAACRRMVSDCVAGAVQRGIERQLWPDMTDLLGDAAVMFPIHAPDGRVVGVGVTEDLAEIKQARSMLLRVNQELQHLVAVDSLTGLANRRAFDRAIDTELRRAARRAEPLAVAMIDIDGFKAYNDALGHQAGDKCLRLVARALDSAARRAGDFLARYGGEEFVAILPGLGMRRARNMGERLRRSVERLAIPHPDAGVVTVSVGLATATPSEAHHELDLLDAADQALYTGKARGRNRTVVVGAGADGQQSAAATGSR